MQPENETPVACTLASDALERRLAWIRQVTNRSLIAHRLEGPKLELRYRLDAKEDLVRIVAEEQKCCAFLRFELNEAPDAVEVTIVAPDGVGPDARWLFDQFLPAGPGAIPASHCGCAPGRCG